MSCVSGSRKGMKYLRRRIRRAISGCLTWGNAMAISGNNARQQLRLSFIIRSNLCKFTWPLRPFSKEGMSKPSFFPQPLGTIFLTGPDGFVYEVPEEVAKKYRMTSARVLGLQHPPPPPHPSAHCPQVFCPHFVLHSHCAYAPHTHT